MRNTTAAALLVAALALTGCGSDTTGPGFTPLNETVDSSSRRLTLECLDGYAFAVYQDQILRFPEADETCF